MLEVFKDYIIKEGKSNNTVKTYVRHIQGYINWFKYTTGEGINKLYRTNILEYKSYLKNIKKDSAKTINNKLSALVKLNECLIEEGIQTDIVITKKRFYKSTNSSSKFGYNR